MNARPVEGKDDTASGHTFKGRYVFDLFVFWENCFKVLLTSVVVIWSQNQNTRPVHTPDTDIFEVRNKQLLLKQAAREIIPPGAYLVQV